MNDMRTNNRTDTKHIRQSKAAPISMRQIREQKERALLWFLASGISLVASLGIGRLLLG